MPGTRRSAGLHQGADVGALRDSVGIASAQGSVVPRWQTRSAPRSSSSSLQARSSLARTAKAPEPAGSRWGPPSRTRRRSPRRRRRRPPPSGTTGDDGKLDPNDPKHGARKMMGLDVGVFVDGVQTSVLRYGDLPSMPSETLEGGAVRYKLVRLREGDRHRAREHQVDPPPRQRRPHRQRRGQRAPQGAEPLPVPVPLGQHRHADRSLGHRRPQERVRRSRDPQGHHLREEGVAAHRREEVLPRRRGRRVLGCRSVRLGRCRQGHAHLRRRQDGRLREAPPARRRARSWATPRPASSKYNVAKLVAGFGVDPTGIKAVELVAGDDVIAHADGDKFTTLAPDFFFTLPKHNHGKVRVHVPAALQASDRRCRQGCAHQQRADFQEHEARDRAR